MTPLPPPKCRWCPERATHTCQKVTGGKKCGRPLCGRHAADNCPEHMVVRRPPRGPGGGLSLPVPKVA